jgi:hypothetical protein
MLLCIVTVASKLPRPTRQDASLLRFSSALFIESLCNRFSAFFSSLLRTPGSLFYPRGKINSSVFMRLSTILEN